MKDAVHEEIPASPYSVVAGSKAFAFGPFHLLPSKRLLIENGRGVALGGRAFDVLIALIDRAGTVVSNEELLARAWPGIVVEAGTLRVHIAALRRALGDGHGGRRFIVNSPGRGYSFVAPVTELQIEPAPPVADPPIDPADNLPRLLTPVFGRELAVAALVTLLPQHRFVTIVGPAGIGKTTVALAVAGTLRPSYPDGIRFVDLAPISGPLLVPSALAAAMGQPVTTGDPIPGLVRVLRSKSMLLVIDNCEHVIEIAARLAEEICKGCRNVHVLATSREALRARGEHIQRLPALETPPALSEPTAQEALTFPAVQLFADRSAAALDTFVLSDANALVIAEICRRLDGIPLAIELAAGRIDTFGVGGVAARLDDRFRLLAQGHRTAPPRHQTLDAAFDWSFQLLDEPAQVVFRRLSIFAGDFDLEAAAEISADEHLAAPEIAEHLATLVSASLVSAKIATEAASYRLLESTRAYAREKLVAESEYNRVARRHAAYYRQLFERAEAEWEVRPAMEWLKDYAFHLDNLRTALDWAFSEAGDTAIAVALTATAVPLWFQLSLVDECLSRVEQAIKLLDAAPEPDLRRRMQLQSALGWPRMRAISGLASGAAAWQETLRLAEAIGDTDYQQRALWALWVDRTNRGEPREALVFAEMFSSLAASVSAAEERVGDRMRARSLHLLGDLAGARDCVERMLDRYTPPASKSHVARYQYDQRILARITLARLLWLQGHADRALREVAETLQAALDLGHTLTLAHVLSDAACPVALLAGDLELAARYTTMLHEQTRAHALDVWNTYADGFLGEIMIRRGEVQPGLGRLRVAIDALAQADFILYHTSFLASLAQGLMTSGQLPGALAAVSQALAQCERTGEAWLLPELHRLRGEILLRGAEAGVLETGEASLVEALRVARGQGALAWELRAATSLARHWGSTNRAVEGRSLLSAILERVTEGFAATDYRAAQALLSELT